MKSYQLFYLTLYCFLLMGFSLPTLYGQNENCLVPEIELGQAIVDYRLELETRDIPEASIIHSSDEELAQALRDHLCEVNDMLFRMFESEGRSFYELTDRDLIRGNARIYPFYYQREPNRNLSVDEWRRDMNDILEQHGIAFSIEFDRLQLSRIEAFNARIYLSADYTFYPAWNEFDRKVQDREVQGRIELVFDYINSEFLDSGFALEIRAITGEMSSREEIGYGEFYVHTTACLESYRGEMGSFWRNSMADRNVLNELVSNMIPQDLPRDDNPEEEGFNDAPFDNWEMESTVSWGIDLGYAFTLDRFGKHGLDFTAGLQFSEIEASFDHNGVGIYSGEDDYIDYSRLRGADANTSNGLGYLQSAQMHASRTSLNISVGYRHNFMNVNRRLVYLSPRFFINSSLSYTNVESSANLGFGFVSNVTNDVTNNNVYGYGQFLDYTIEERSMGNAIADGSLVYGLGLAAGFSLPMDRAGNIFLSGRLYYDHALGGSVLVHNSREQHYLNMSDFSQGDNYLSDFGDHFRSSRFGLSIGLSYLVLK